MVRRRCASKRPQIVARREAALKEQAIEQDRAASELRRREGALAVRERETEAAARR